MNDKIVQAISHPGVLAIFSHSQRKIAPLSLPRTITTLWSKIVKVVDGFGGTMAVRLPTSSGAWNLHSVAWLVSTYRLETGVNNSLRPNTVFTNNVHWRRSLDYYDCRDDRFEALHCCLARAQYHKEQLAALGYICDNNICNQPRLLL